MPTIRDTNQIAASILRTATTTQPRPGETPIDRLNRAIALEAGQASAAKVPLDQRRANGLKGAIARWGTIRERDNSPMSTRPKNLDVSQLAKRILDEATGEEPKTEAPTPKPEKNQAAVELGKLGGKKGGIARKEALSPEQRTEIAKKAAKKRWTSEQQ